MPYQVFTLEEVADYLHLARPDIERFVKDHEIPFETRGGRVIFRQREIDAWASQRILGLQDRPLAEYHQRSSQGTREFLPHEAIMPEMIEPAFIHPALTAKTKASLLRDIVALAEKTGRVNDAKELLTSLEEREELCSTALPGGMALLHPRYHQPYMFETSFIVLGRPIQDIHFSAPDGQPTELFFLVCCQDDRIHLHTLARLCMMAMKTELIPRLRQAPDVDAMHEVLIACEQEVLAAKKH